MKLSEDTTIGELKSQFREFFPFLKIEFYYPHQSEGPAGGERRLPGPEVPLGLVRKKNINGNISIDPGLDAAALEATFRDIFGLQTKIFRLSFGNWVEAGGKEGFSLLEQNLRGMKSSERALIV